MELSELNAKQVDISNEELTKLKDLVSKLSKEIAELKEREKIY